MSDLYEPLRKRLRELGWKSVQRWKLTFWQSPHGGEFAEEEAFAALQRIDKDESRAAKEGDRSADEIL